MEEKLLDRKNVPAYMLSTENETPRKKKRTKSEKNKNKTTCECVLLRWAPARMKGLGAGISASGGESRGIAESVNDAHKWDALA